MMLPEDLVMSVASSLGGLCEQLTFLGGAVVPLLVTEKGARPPRPTRDVDVTIELTSRLGFYEIEAALRSKGFENAIEGPVCRFKRDEFILDVMPTDPAILGFSNPWYSTAIRTAKRYELKNNITINLIEAACFLATKLEAFNSPTRADNGDIYVSRDFEDIVTVIDGRPTIAKEVSSADPELREYIQGCFLTLTNRANWLDGISAHVGYGRTEDVIERITSIIEA